jgi:hypothetical protein
VAAAQSAVAERIADIPSEEGDDVKMPKHE